MIFLPCRRRWRRPSVLHRKTLPQAAFTAAEEVKSCRGPHKMRLHFVGRARRRCGTSVRCRCLPRRSWPSSSWTAIDPLALPPHRDTCSKRDTERLCVPCLFSYFSGAPRRSGGCRHRKTASCSARRSSPSGWDRARSKFSISASRFAGCSGCPFIFTYRSRTV